MPGRQHAIDHREERYLSGAAEAATAVDADNPLLATQLDRATQADDDFSEDSCEAVRAVFTEIRRTLAGSDESLLFGPGALFRDDDPFEGVFAEATEAPCAPVDPCMFEDVTERVPAWAGCSETEPDGAVAAG